MTSEPPPDDDADAAACNVLVVEDEFFIAGDLVRALRRSGMVAVGPVGDAAAATVMLDTVRVDFAIVDINLDGAISFTLATELRRRRIPFLFLTGYDGSVVPAEFADAVVLQKPSESDAVVAEIKRLGTLPIAN